MKTLIAMISVLAIEAFTPESNIGRTIFEIFIVIWALGADILENTVRIKNDENSQKLKELNKLMFERDLNEMALENETKNNQDGNSRKKNK